MILSDKTIRRHLEMGELIKSPINEIQIQPASVDLRLGEDFKCLGKEGNPATLILNYLKRIPYRKHAYSAIAPGDFVLGTTMETISLPSNVGAVVMGRSSVGRTGLFVENAGWIDPGFEGELTLELFNSTKHFIKKPIGERICQIIFYKIDEEVERPYGSCDVGSKYQGQKGAKRSLIHFDHI